MALTPDYTAAPTEKSASLSPFAKNLIVVSTVILVLSALVCVIGGFAVVTVLFLEPEHLARDYSISGFKSYLFNRMVPARQSKVVVFRMKAIAEGEFGSPVSVRAGSYPKKIDNIAITIVEDASSR